MTITGNAVATRTGHSPVPLSGLVIKPGQEIFNANQRAGLAVLGIKGCSDAELAVFMHYCQKTQLDPFSKQIYYIARRVRDGDQWVTKWTIQVGIDGFRVIRDRIADRLGITVEYEDTTWYDADGGEHDVWLWDYPPAAAKVTVLRNGKRYPAVCRTASYMQTNKQGEPVSQWKTQPDHMIEKCAEAFALRRAFPHDLGGVYIPEEIPRGDEPGEVAAAVRITAEDVTTQRPRRPAAPPEPEVHDAEIVPEPEPAAETGPGRGRPGSSPDARPTSAALAKLGKALTKVRLGTPEDVAVFLAWAAGRSEATRLEALTHGETGQITEYLDEALKAADNDSDVAGSRIWTAYRDAHPAPEPDDSDDLGEASDG